MATETELTLSLPPAKNADFYHWLAAHALTPAPATLQRSIHYDTPTLALKQKDITLYLWRHNGQWQQTLRLAASAATPCLSPQKALLNTPALAPDRFTSRKIRQLLTRNDIATALLPLFTIKVKRTCWQLKDTDGNVLDIYLEQGTIKGRGQTQDINDIKIALQQGQPHAVFELAQQLLTTGLPLFPQLQNQTERGYALYRDHAAVAPDKARQPALYASMTPPQALRTVMLETIRHLQANVPGILEEDNIECLHEARVALRRLRATQTAFSAIIPATDRSELAAETRWLATILGQVRDLDVFLTQTLPAIEIPDNTTSFTALQRTMLARREQHRQTARNALTSPRYAALLIQLLARLAQPPARSLPSPTLRHFAQHALNQRWQLVMRLIRKWDTLGQDQRHELRKRVKKLRYAVTFFAPLYRKKAVARYSRRLQQLQDSLGKMNDRFTAQAFLATFQHENVTLAHETGFITGWLACQARLSEAQLANALRRLQQSAVFW